MTLEEWVKNKYIQFDIPSGLTVKVKKVDFIDLASDLEPEALVLAQIFNEPVENTPSVQETIERANKLSKLLHSICSRVLIEPKYEEVKDFLSLTDVDAIVNQALGVKILSDLKSDSE